MFQEKNDGNVDSFGKVVTGKQQMHFVLWWIKRSVWNIIFPRPRWSLGYIQIKSTSPIFRKCGQLCLFWKQKQLRASEKKKQHLDIFGTTLDVVRGPPESLQTNNHQTTRFCCRLHDATKLCPHDDFWDKKKKTTGGAAITDHHLSLVFVPDF